MQNVSDETGLKPFVFRETFFFCRHVSLQLLDVRHKPLLPHDKRSSVNFTNVLRTAFTLIDPESVKNTVKSLLFTLLGSTSIKAVCRTLMKLSPNSTEFVVNGVIQFHQQNFA